MGMAKGGIIARGGTVVVEGMVTGVHTGVGGSRFRWGEGRRGRRVGVEMKEAPPSAQKKISDITFDSLVFEGYLISCHEKCTPRTPPAPDAQIIVHNTITFGTRRNSLNHPPTRAPPSPPLWDPAAPAPHETEWHRRYNSGYHRHYPPH